VKNGSKRYRYYTCVSAQKNGWASCPSKSAPADAIERLVVDRIRCVGRDPAMLREVLSQVAEHQRQAVAALEAERRGLERDLAGWHAEVRRVAARPGDAEAAGRLADLHERIGEAEGRVRELRELARKAQAQVLDEPAAAEALARFDPVWESLTPNEQARIVALLVERVEYDGARGKASITFRPTGIQALAEELARGRKGRRT
jgi:site-specific DNA recombinase